MSNLSICMASLASQVIWEESLSIILKFLIEGKGWWKSVQWSSMADVLDLSCSLTLSPMDLEVSPMYEELQPSAQHSQWYTMSFFWLVGTLCLGCIRRDLRVFTPLKQTCTAMYLVMDKSQYVDKYMALLDDTKVYKPCKDTTKNYTEMSRKLFDNSTETMELQDLVGGASTTTTSSFQQVTPLQHLGSMVYLLPYATHSLNLWDCNIPVS